jgi:hypothetical protein
MFALTMSDIFKSFKDNMKDINYIPLSVDSCVKGYKLDQLFIKDKDLILTDDYINIIKPSLSLSYVPDEFIFQIF